MQINGILRHTPPSQNHAMQTKLRENAYFAAKILLLNGLGTDFASVARNCKDLKINPLGTPFFMRYIGQILVLFWQGAICGARQSWLRWVSLGIRWLGKAVKDGKSSRVQAGSGKGVQALAGQRSQGWQGRQVEARQRSQVQSRFGGSRCGRRGIGKAVRVSLGPALAWSGNAVLVGLSESW